MARCAHPHYTLDLGLKENGKRNLKFLGFRADLSSWKQLCARYGDKAVLPLPCGKCIQCKINHAKEWAVRCVLEALEHQSNFFITLTYDDEHLPVDGKLHKDELQRFFKRARKEFGSFKYLACGEYGTGGTHRPHFHILAFGLDIPDQRAVLGHPKSKRFEKVWPYGAYSIDEVSYASANYVAQYSMKKIWKNADTGEFIVASNRPGIGYSWCVKNINKLLEYDAVYGYFGDVREARLPRYFDKVAEILDGERFEWMKKKRLDKDNSIEINKMLVHCFSEVEQLLEYEENITLNDFMNKRKGVRKL